MRKKRIVVVCPGRGSYSRETSNYLENVDSNLRAIIEEQDKIRSAKKLKSVFELDKTIFRAKTHMTGENASPLIYSCSLKDYYSINKEEYEKQRAFKTIEFIRKFFIKSAFISNRLSPLMEFIGSLAVAISIYVGGVFVLNESMTTGQFMSFLVSLLLAYPPVKALGNLNISVQEGLAGAERIFLLLVFIIYKTNQFKYSIIGDSMISSFKLT